METAQWVLAISEAAADVCVSVCVCVVCVAVEECNYEHQIKLIYMDKGSQ